MYEVQPQPRDLPARAQRFPSYIPEIEVLSELMLPSATVRLARYRWDAMAQIDVVEPDLTLYWRLRPLSVRMTGAILYGPTTHFGRMMLLDTPYRAMAAGEHEEVVSLGCHFDRQWLASHLPSGSLPSGIAVSSLDFRHENIQFLMQRMAHELLRPGTGSDVLVDALLIAAAIDLTRAIEHHHNVQSPLSEADRFIQSSSEIVNVAQVAEHCGMSQSHLRRIVREQTGRRVSDLIEDERISRARYLLGNTTLPLKVISYRIGYGQQSAFSNAFRTRCGMSPLQFRKQAAGKPRSP